MTTNNKVLTNKVLTLSVIFEASSLNYGESLGNFSQLKKLIREDGEAHTYLSRQALIYNIKEQMGIDTTKINKDKSVLQYDNNYNIDVSSEVDLFGYMRTNGDTKTRNARVRVTNAISLEAFKYDVDFLTNKGLYDRAKKQKLDLGDEVKGNNLAQSEIHQSYYSYSIAIELDKIGIDDNYDLEISNEEKAQRVNGLLKTIQHLVRDIKGRRENLAPRFAIGGLYDFKNLYFDNELKISGRKLLVDNIKEILEDDDDIANNTMVGVKATSFDNVEEIKDKLNAISIGSMFKELETKVNEYYL